MTRVAITGVSGHLGSKLLDRLDQEPDVECIVGIDRKPPKSSSPKLKFYCRDIREPFGSVLAENQVDSAIHLAFVLVPGHKTQRAQEVNIGGTENFIRACHRDSVRWVLFLSSNTVYGANPDNEVPLTEESRLKPDSQWPYAWHKWQCEVMMKGFMEDHDNKKVAIVRCCAVLGPNGVGSGIKEMFTPVVMVRCVGRDGLWQFIHEDDWVELTVTMLRQKPEGVFNAAGDGCVSYSEIASAMGRWVLPIPGKALKMGLAFSWNLHLQSKSPVGGLRFIKYPLVMSTEKVQEATGFRFRHTSRDTLDAYIAKPAKGREEKAAQKQAFLQASSGEAYITKTQLTGENLLSSDPEGRADPQI